MIAPKGLSKLFLGLLVGFLGVILLFKEVIAAYPNLVVWADNPDFPLIYWIVNWGYHVIFEVKQPQSFWNANSFYPHTMTLAYSDSILSIQMFFAPLRLLGVEPLISLYLSLGGVCILGYISTQYGLYRLRGFSTIEIIFVSFAAHFGLSIASYLYHYQLFGFQVAPAFFIFLYLYLRDFRLWDLVIALSLYAIGVLFAIYLAPMLFVIALMTSIPFVIARLRKMGPAKLIRIIGLRGSLTLVGFGIVLYWVQFKTYFEVENRFPKQPLEDKIAYSANLTSLFSGISPFSKWYGLFAPSTYGAWEYQYFPGMILLCLSMLLMLFIVGNFIRQKNCLFCEIKRDFLIFLLIVFIGSLVLSWGPFYKLNHAVKLPYYYLSNITFGLNSIRAPGRFGMFIGLPMALFSIMSMRFLIPDQTRRQTIVGLLFVFLVIESFTTFPAQPFTLDPNGIYFRVSQEIDWGTPLLELPVFGKDNLDTIRIAANHMKSSTIHWGRMVDGYGAKTTDEYQLLLYYDNLVQNEVRSPKLLVNFAKRHGIAYLLIHINDYNLPVQEKWIETLQKVEGKTIFQLGNVMLVRVR